MDPFRFFRRKKRKRNERASTYSSRHRRTEFSRGAAPRLALLVAFIATALVLLPPARPAQDVMFKAGEIADRDVIAPFNFSVPLPQEELEVVRAKAALQVPPVYRRQRDVERDLARDLVSLLDTVTVIINSDTLAPEARVNAIAGWLPSLSSGTHRVIADPRSFKALNRASRDYQSAVFRRGLMDNSALIRRNAYTEISVLDDSGEETRKVADVTDQGRLDQVVREEALTRFGSDRERAEVFFELVRGHLLPNLIFDVDETNRRRSAATATVKGYFEVSKNERIIGKHDRVTREQERTLRALEDTRAAQEVEQSPLVMFGLYASRALSLLLFGILFGGYLFVFHPRVYCSLSPFTAVFAVSMLYLLFTAIVIRFGLDPFLIPVAFATVMLSALFDIRLGFVSGLFYGLLIQIVTPYGMDVAFAGMLAGAMGVVGIDRMKSRSHVYAVFLSIAAAYVAATVALRLGSAESLTEAARSAFWGVANGMFSSAAVMFLLPICEHVFGRTSRFTLLELTDLNRPVLKRLNMEAHGTYHHSMLIGNLVDAVADHIGADSLRARVMAYYHDIGKIFKPEYFAENQGGGFNKHEKVTPQMSALILVSHVKDGVELAREEKLPEMVIDGIREHHGTGVMAYFYQKALETDSHSSVNKDDFRYPGPRPQSKETGLLMCADTVEAAVRSLKDPSPTSIRNMVTKLIDGRIRDGELDESGLTLRDLHVIREKFITILTGIYHKRIAYPGQEEDSAPAPEAELSEASGESVARSV